MGKTMREKDEDHLVNIETMRQRKAPLSYAAPAPNTALYLKRKREATYKTAFTLNTPENHNTKTANQFQSTGS